MAKKGMPPTKGGKKAPPKTKPTGSPKAHALAVALAALIAFSACTPVAPTPVPQGGNNTTVIVNVGNGTPNGGASPAPGSGSQLVFGAKIGEFGERGANPANGPRETRVGNVSDVTCSPTDSSGQVYKTTNPSSLVYFKQLGGSGAGVFAVSEENSYNGTVSCKTTGVVVLECSLRDTATGTVVTGGNAGTAEDSPWSMNCVS